MRLNLILTMMDIYINSNMNPLTKFTSSSRSLELKDIFSWKIPQMITKTIPISMRIVIRYQGIIQKKSASGSRTVPCLVIFFGNFILI